MDEPEAALSPQRQLSFLILLHDLVKANDNIQSDHRHAFSDFVGLPGSADFILRGGQIRPINYRESQPFQLVSRFIAAPERYINALFSELPFNEDD